MPVLSPGFFLPDRQQHQPQESQNEEQEEEIAVLNARSSFGTLVGKIDTGNQGRFLENDPSKIDGSLKPGFRKVRRVPKQGPVEIRLTLILGKPKIHFTVKPGLGRIQCFVKPAPGKARPLKKPGARKPGVICKGDFQEFREAVKPRPVNAAFPRNRA